jgi:hypothetical protein
MSRESAKRSLPLAPSGQVFRCLSLWHAVAVVATRSATDPPPMLFKLSVRLQGGPKRAAHSVAEGSAPPPAGMRAAAR